ncbi:hypothetical protein [Paracoccus sp. M683]|uniref:hypothetical protein n=1 Tax=Paracoccus sp. M683 TaxID=2594268 RepID=UPI00163D8DBA|nr:hypothetical protein [Paracoccus sp. M683]
MNSIIYLVGLVVVVLFILSVLGRVDKRDSPWAWGMIQAGICDGDQLGTRPYVGRGVGVL